MAHFSVSDLISYTVISAKQFVYSPLNRLSIWMHSSRSERSLVSKILLDTKQSLKEIHGSKERSLSDYIAVGRYYVLKSLTVLILIVILLLPIAAVLWGYP